MSATINKYRLYCNTEAQYKYVWSETVPTVCPSNASDSINASSITIVDTVSTNEVSIKEESVPTGGYFATTTMKVIAPPNSVSYTRKKFRYPINSLSVTFISGTEHSGDKFNMYAGRDTLVGYITAPITAYSGWAAGTYNPSDIIYHSGYNYKCTTLTSDEPALDNLNWQTVDTILYASSSVLANVWNGFHLALQDGTHYESLNEIACINKVNGTITMVGAPQYSYSPLTPTYILATMYYIHDYNLHHPWQHIIGESKIGGTYIPANTNIEVEYFNYSASDTKTLIGMVEYLY
jgi:hypothetical protein